MILTLRWRVPERPVATRWRGPEGMLSAVGRNPSMPIAALIGPQGPPGTGVLRFDIALPTGTWIFAHGLGRVPMAQCFLASGEQVFPDVVADATHITVTHAAPQSGFILAS